MEKQNNENTNKRELRIKIIKRANRLFHTYGVKEVKMNDIATSLGISKRTLYELFKDKEELLYDGLRYEHSEMIKQSKDIIRNSQGTMNTILLLYTFYIKKIETISKTFFRDLEKYPKVLKENETKMRYSERKIKIWLENGIKEGIFRNDTNFDILLHILRDNVKFITQTTQFDHYTVEQLSNTFILSYLRGVATIKGQEIIEEYIKENKIV